MVNLYCVTLAYGFTNGMLNYPTMNIIIRINIGINIRINVRSRNKTKTKWYRCIKCRRHRCLTKTITYWVVRNKRTC